MFRDGSQRVQQRFCHVPVNGADADVTTLIGAGRGEYLLG